MPRCGGRGWRRRRLASNRAARNWPGKTTIFMTVSEQEVYFIFWDKNLVLSDCCFRSLSLTLIETAPAIANSGAATLLNIFQEIATKITKVHKIVITDYCWTQIVIQPSQESSLSYSMCSLAAVIGPHLPGRFGRSENFSFHRCSFPLSPQWWYECDINCPTFARNI